MHVVESAADQMFNDIKPDLSSRMPQYQGDLELINHSAGSLTSQAYHKRWILKNENLADAAEKASVAAEWMGGRTYPQQRLNDAWMLELSGHFHDSAAGTATPRAYQFSWNDDIIAANQFADVFTSASTAIASGLDSQTKGTPIVVFNPLNIAREDLVEAEHDRRAPPKRCASWPGRQGSTGATGRWKSSFRRQSSFRRIRRLRRVAGGRSRARTRS